MIRGDRVSENKVIQISNKEFDEIKKTSQNQNTFICEIDGSKLTDMDSYLLEFWRELRFPNTGFVNHDAYLDWMRDLEWLDSEKYVLFILKHDLVAYSIKNRLLQDFENIILPWWGKEVALCVVGGETKPFHVYLVNSD